MRRVAGLLAVLALAAGCGGRERAAPGAAPSEASSQRQPPGVTLSRERQEAAGLELRTLAAASWRAGPRAPGSVLDPVPLAALAAELSTAEAARDASRAELARSRTLNADASNVSKRSLEAAQAQFRADDDHARLAGRQLAMSWGRGIAALSGPDREALVAGLVDGRIAMARVDLPAGELADAAGPPGAGASASAPPLEPVAGWVSVLGSDAPPVAAAAIEEAPAVNPELPGRGFLLRFEPAGPRLRPGAAVSARLELAGEPRHGVVIPREALVRFGGLAWAYVRRDGDRFERLAVPLDAPTDDGWFCDARFAPGDEVIVTGAQLLLGEEQRERLQLGIEGDPAGGEN